MRSSNEWDCAGERTHSWGDDNSDPDQPVFEVDMASLIRLGGLTPKDIKFFTRLKRRLELGGSKSIGKFPDLVPKMKRSKPLGFGKVDSVKVTP